MASPHIAGKGTASDHAHLLHDHIHSAAKCYPTLAADVTVTGAAGAWTLGSLVEVVPASTITSDFDIHWISISNTSAADTYELQLYYGAGDTEATCVRFTRGAGATTNSQVPIITPLIPKNSRVRAAVASSGGGSDTVDISIMYHTY